MSLASVLPSPLIEIRAAASIDEQHCSCLGLPIAEARPGAGHLSAAGRSRGGGWCCSGLHIHESKSGATSSQLLGPVLLDRLAHHLLVDPEFREQPGGFIALGQRHEQVVYPEFRASFFKCMAAGRHQQPVRIRAGRDSEGKPTLRTRSSACSGYANLRVMPNREFLVMDDYGTGGIWAVMSAPSKAALEAAYPELIVVDERPSWVDHAEYERIKARSGFEFDQPQGYWTRFFRPT